MVQRKTLLGLVKSLKRVLWGRTDGPDRVLDYVTSELSQTSLTVGVDDLEDCFSSDQLTRLREVLCQVLNEIIHSHGGFVESVLADGCHDENL